MLEIKSRYINGSRIKAISFLLRLIYLIDIIQSQNTAFM